MASRIPNKAPDKAKAFTKPGVELRYYDAKHQYFARGGKWSEWTWLPSVSTIAKLSDPPGDRLVAWAIRQTADRVEAFLASGKITRERVGQAIAEARVAAERKKESAGDYGTAAHALFERAVKTKVWRGRVDPALRAALEAMRAWRDEWAVEVIDQEFLLLHPELGYAGTGDLLCKVTPPGEKRARAYWDLKTGKGVYRSNMAQIAGYDAADRAVGQPGFQVAGLLHLPEGAGEIKIVRQHDREGDTRAFEAARFLHWWAKEQDRFENRRAA